MYIAKGPSTITIKYDKSKEILTIIHEQFRIFHTVFKDRLLEMCQYKSASLNELIRSTPYTFDDNP